jgi:MMP 1-O-methyltransferase
MMLSYSFDRAWSFAERIKGWLRREEGELLYRLSAEACLYSRVVELGSYCGRSSIVLAASLAGRSQLPLACVDTFRGSCEHQPGGRYFDPDMLVGGVVNTYPAFVRSLKAAELWDHVEAMQLSTREAATKFTDPVGLLFMDADHEYTAVCEDLRFWLSRVVSNGYIVLHDVGEWSGPTRAAADLLEAGFKRFAQAGTALALRKPTAR